MSLYVCIYVSICFIFRKIIDTISFKEVTEKKLLKNLTYLFMYATFYYYYSSQNISDDIWLLFSASLKMKKPSKAFIINRYVYVPHHNIQILLVQFFCYVSFREKILEILIYRCRSLHEMSNSYTKHIRNRNFCMNYSAEESIN